MNPELRTNFVVSSSANGTYIISLYLESFPKRESLTDINPSVSTITISLKVLTPPYLLVKISSTILESLLWVIVKESFSINFTRLSQLF